MSKALWFLAGGLAALGVGYAVRGSGIQGLGRNRGTSPGAGPGGYCECPSCGAVEPHKTGVPCYLTPCSSCGEKMMARSHGGL